MRLHVLLLISEPDAFNPFAVAHHVRHPLSSIQPNVMRIQYDFIDSDQSKLRASHLSFLLRSMITVRESTMQTPICLSNFQSIFDPTFRTAGGHS